MDRYRLKLKLIYLHIRRFWIRTKILIWYIKNCLGKIYLCAHICWTKLNIFWIDVEMWILGYGWRKEEWQKNFKKEE